MKDQLKYLRSVGVSSVSIRELKDGHMEKMRKRPFQLCLELLSFLERKRRNALLFLFV